MLCDTREELVGGEDSETEHALITVVPWKSSFAKWKLSWKARIKHVRDVHPGVGLYRAAIA